MVSLEGCGKNLTKLYECNRKRCGIRCSYPMCKHTLDIEFAERPNDDDFDLADGYLVQRIAPPIRCAIQGSDGNGAGNFFQL